MLKIKYTLLILLGLASFILHSKEMDHEKTNDLYVHFSTAKELPWASGANYISNFAFKNAVHTKASLPSSNRKRNLIKKVKIVAKNTLELELADDLYFELQDQEWKATTEDFKFTLIRPFLISKDKNRFKEIFLNIKGFEQLENIKGNVDWRKLEFEGLKILSNEKIRIEVKKDFSKFNKTLLEMGFYVLSPKCFDESGKNVLGFPCGTGPYKVQSFDKDTAEVRLLLRNRFRENYPLAPVKVVIITDDSNRGDILWKDMWDIDKSQYNHRIIKNPLGTIGFFFNLQTEFGKSEAFRDAVAAALNRTEITEGFPSLLANDALIPHGKKGHINFKNSPNSQYDPARAKMLIKKYFGGKVEVDCEVYGQTEYELKKSNFTKIKDQLKSVGIIINYKKYDPKNKYKTPLFIAGMALQDFSNPSFVYSFFREGTIFKNSYPKYDKEFDLLYRNIDIKNSSTLFDIADYFYRRNYIVPLWDLYSNYFYKKGVVKSLGDQKGGLSFHLLKVQMEKSE